MFGGIFLSFVIIIIFIESELILSSFFIKIDLKLIFYVFIISIISQLGDLTVSYFKRISNIKNTGRLIPGHGGILDRIDGMLFAYPFSYFFLLYKLMQKKIAIFGSTGSIGRTLLNIISSNKKI